MLGLSFESVFLFGYGLNSCAALSMIQEAFNRNILPRSASIFALGKCTSVSSC